MGSCYIIAANLSGDISIQKNLDDLVIAADGGYKAAVKGGIVPDIVLGDFDSLGFVPDAANIITLPVEKDDTDTLAAVRIGLKKGYKCFYIYGGLGGRTDHTIANIQTLSFITDNGGRGYLVSGEEVLTVIKNSFIEFSEKAEGTVSVFAYGGVAEGVTVSGLKYNLCNATLDTSFPIGVSNSFIGKKSSITVQNGKLLITFKELKNIL